MWLIKTQDMTSKASDVFCFFLWHLIFGNVLLYEHCATRVKEEEPSRKSWTFRWKRPQNCSSCAPPGLQRFVSRVQEEQVMYKVELGRCSYRVLPRPQCQGFGSWLRRFAELSPVTRWRPVQTSMDQKSLKKKSGLGWSSFVTMQFVLNNPLWKAQSFKSIKCILSDI